MTILSAGHSLGSYQRVGQSSLQGL